ncbi:MAG: prealbumin-like fold domain-containing protein [bacterium]
MVNVSFSRFSAVVRKTNSSCGNQQRLSWRNLFLIIPVLAVLGLALQSNVARATVLIDDFSEVQTPPLFGGVGGVFIFTNDAVFPDTGQGTLGGLVKAVGGTRDINAEITAGGLGQNIQAFVQGDIYSHAQNPGLSGDSTITWDADLDPLALDPVGLGGVDLTQAGTQDAIELRILFADLNATLNLNVFTDAANFSSTSLNFANTVNSTVVVIPYSSFTVSGGTGADFANVGAIQLSVDGTSVPGLDVQIELIQTTSTITADKTATIVSGAANGLDANDIIEYTVTVHNNSVVDISGVDFTDTVDANTTLLCNAPDAPVLPAGASLTLCDSGAGTITVNTGPTLIPAGGTADIVFRVQVNNAIPANTPEICNQGSVDFGSLVGVLTDDTATFAIPNDPTCLDLNGQVTIIKQTVPAGLPQSFDFTGDLGAFSLVHGASQTQSLPAGAYNVVETALANWTLTNLVCVDSITGDSTVDIPNATSTINLERGESVTCTYTNTAANGTIIVKKLTNPTGSPQSFAFNPSWKAGFNLMDTQTDSTSVTPGNGYSVSETIPAGWSQTSVACDDGSPVSNIDVSPGETVTCTFTNTQDATIIVRKNTDPAGSVQSFTFSPSWKGSFNLVDGGADTTTGLSAGAYNVSETLPAGWLQTAASCIGSINAVAQNPSNFNVLAGETMTCTFDNTQQGTLIVVKQTIPSGLTQSFTFNPSWKANFNLSDGGSDSTLVNPATYNVSETVPANWSQTSATCDDGSPVSAINVAAGETVTCTFVNTADNGTIIVEKLTNPSGSLQSFAFNPSWKAGFNLLDTQTDSTSVTPGNGYNVNETVPAGWTQTSALCDDGSPINNIDVAPGETVRCTFTNTQDATIIVRKNTTPAGSPQSFAFTPSWKGGFNLTDGGTDTTTGLSAGAYNVSEALPAGWTQTSASCVGSINATPQSPGGFNVLAGETMTCTFDNTQQSTLIIQKQTIPSGLTQSFTFTPDWKGNFNLSDGGSDSTTVAAGVYAVSETVPANWSQTSANCDDGSPVNAINVAAGETVTCTFVNTADNGTIIVEKLTNPSGSLQSFAFNPSWKAGFNLLDTQTDSTSVTPGNGYNVNETVPAGWTQTSALCDDGSPINNIDVAPGETVRCTFTNTQDATIIVRKNTTPAGSPQSFAFTPSWKGGFNLTDGGTDTTTGLSAGAYNVSEALPAGWTQTSASCVGSINATPQSPGGFNVLAGETMTCSFVNTQGGTIIVEKQTDPDGSLDNFTFTGDAAGTIQDNGQIVVGGLAPGVYTSTETPTAGWDLTSISCDDADSIGVTATGVTTFNLQAGETVTCVYNNRQRGTIIVEKQTDPANAPDGFSFTGNAAGTIQDNGTIVVGNLLPGTYTSVESATAGWDLTGISCDDADSTGSVATSTATFNLQAGETVRCTFNNTQRGTIIVEKQTDPANAPDSFAFTGNAAGTIQDNGTIVVGNLVPGTYTSVETALAGWQLTGISCDDADSTGSLGTSTANFNLQAGETVRCTFTNTKLGSITVEKQTDPANAPDSFTFTGTAAGSIVDNGTIVVGNLLPGSYTSVESATAGWDLTDITCNDLDSSGDTGTRTASFELQAGEDVTCVFTNTQSGTIIVEKQTDPDGSVENFTFTGDAAGTIQDNGQIVVNGLAPGVYTSTETPVAGWDLTDISCDDADSVGVTGTGVTTFNLQAGETITCVYTNTQRGTIIVEKQTDPANAPDNFVFTGDAAGTIQDNGTIVVNDLVPGNYSSVETLQTGWDVTGITCDDSDSTGDVGNRTANFILQAGETVRCVFTNTQRGTIIVEKQTDPDGAPGNFTFTGDAAGTIQDNGQIMVNNLIPGTYTSVETAQANWELASIVCDDADSTVDVPNATATFELQPGETITCIFTNNLLSPDLEITKTDGGIQFVDEGDILEYFLNYSNQSLIDATNVTLTETVPQYTTFSSIGSTPGWSCANGAPAGTICTLNVGTLVGGDSGQAIFAVVVDNITVPDPITGLCPDPNIAFFLDNEATVESDEGDSDSADNTGAENTPVVTNCTPALPIPTLNGFGIWAFILMMLSIGGLELRRKRFFN